MFVISRCQTALHPRLGREGPTPVNKAEKRPQAPWKDTGDVPPPGLVGLVLLFRFLNG